MMDFDPVSGQWYPRSSTPVPTVLTRALLDGSNNSEIDSLNRMIIVEGAMSTRLTVTVLANGNNDGGTRRSECQQAAEMLGLVAQQLIATEALSGTIVDRNGVATASYVYTPTAPS